MAFNQNSSTRSKNQFAARMVSNKTNATVNWVHLTDDFARKVCGVNSVAEITPSQALEFLPSLLDNDRVSVVITDMTAEREIIPADEF